MGLLADIVRIGLIAGTLDIAENLLFNAARGVSPKTVFQFIASGLIGRHAFHAGEFSVALGLTIHYSIAVFWTAVYFVMSRRMTVLIRRPVLSGILFGGTVYLCMNMLVLPFTRIPHQAAAMTFASRMSGVLALLFCFGLTIALLVQQLPLEQSSLAPYDEDMGLR